MFPLLGKPTVAHGESPGTTEGHFVSEQQEREISSTPVTAGVALPVVVAHTGDCVFTLEVDMTTVQSDSGHSPLILHTRPVFEMSDELFFDFCQTNREWRIERNALGEVLIMPPAEGETSHGNAFLTTSLNTWALQDGTGVVFDSSGGFELPSTATRSPDAAWVRRSRLATLTPEQKNVFFHCVQTLS